MPIRKIASNQLSLDSFACAPEVLSPAPEVHRAPEKIPLGYCKVTVVTPQIKEAEARALLKSFEPAPEPPPESITHRDVLGEVFGDDVAGKIFSYGTCQHPLAKLCQSVKLENALSEKEPGVYETFFGRPKKAIQWEDPCKGRRDIYPFIGSIDFGRVNSLLLRGKTYAQSCFWEKNGMRLQRSYYGEPEDEDDELSEDFYSENCGELMYHCTYRIPTLLLLRGLQ